MRVVAGVARGRRLQSPPGRELRPTTDRVREAVFSSLESMGMVADRDVLDLFAGTGAMGIEALSRGARSAVFVDSDPAALAAVKANLRATGLQGGTAVRADALRFLQGAPGPFDVAFVDPPYAFDRWSDVLDGLVAGVAVLESDRPLELPAGWKVLRSRRYGGTVVTLAVRQ